MKLVKSRVSGFGTTERTKLHLSIPFLSEYLDHTMKLRTKIRSDWFNCLREITVKLDKKCVLGVRLTNPKAFLKLFLSDRPESKRKLRSLPSYIVICPAVLVIL